MKRIDLIRQVEETGCVLIRHGAKHDWYQIPAQAPISLFHAIKRSRTISPATSSAS